MGGLYRREKALFGNGYGLPRVTRDLLARGKSYQKAGDIRMNVDDPYYPSKLAVGPEVRIQTS